MDQEYLFRPVIKVDDGDELKAFEPYYLFLIGFFFGLLPALILSIKNCLWLRVSKNIIIMIVALASIAFIGKFIYLGIYYNANHGQLKEVEYLRPERKSASQLLKDRINKSKVEKIEKKSPIVLEWEDKRGNVRIFDRAFGILITLIAFFIYRNSYKVVKNLTGGIQPMLGWGVGIVIASALVELIISQIFFGGIL